jgi:hypothetical protein
VRLPLREHDDVTAGLRRVRERFGEQAFAQARQVITSLPGDPFLGDCSPTIRNGGAVHLRQFAIRPDTTEAAADRRLGSQPAKTSRLGAMLASCPQSHQETGCAFRSVDRDRAWRRSWVVAQGAARGRGGRRPGGREVADGPGEGRARRCTTVGGRLPGAPPFLVLDQRPLPLGRPNAALRPKEVSCVCGLRWPNFLAPATAGSLSFQTTRPRRMSDW